MNEIRQMNLELLCIFLLLESETVQMFTDRYINFDDLSMDFGH